MSTGEAFVSFRRTSVPGLPVALQLLSLQLRPLSSGQNTNIGENFYTSDSQLSPLLSPHSDSLSLP